MTSPRSSRSALLTSPSARLRGASLALAALLLAGCAPTPDSTPTPTPLFASQDEAFAAAEATFAQYIEALNRVDPAKPESFEPLFALSSGSVEKADRKNFSEMHAKDQSLSGTTRVLSFEGTSGKPPYGKVRAVVCIDVSQVQITNSDGSSGVNVDRPDVYAINVDFVVISHDELSVDAATPAEDYTCPAP